MDILFNSSASYKGAVKTIAMRKAGGQEECKFDFSCSPAFLILILPWIPTQIAATSGKSHLARKAMLLMELRLVFLRFANSWYRYPVSRLKLDFSQPRTRQRSHARSKRDLSETAYFVRGSWVISARAGSPAPSCAQSVKWTTKYMHGRVFRREKESRRGFFSRPLRPKKRRDAGEHLVAKGFVHRVCPQRPVGVRSSSFTDSATQPRAAPIVGLAA